MQNHTQKINTQSGFTLVEVLITFFIIGVTLVLYNATSQSVVLNKGNKYKEVALRIADQKMQTIRTGGFDSIPATGTFSDPLLSSIPSGAGNITTTDLNDDTKVVTVRVSWSNPQSNGTQEVELETYITVGGLGQ